eukprot:4637321-Pyramimonas_sp.AAC.1
MCDAALLRPTPDQLEALPSLTSARDTPSFQTVPTPPRPTSATHLLDSLPLFSATRLSSSLRKLRPSLSRHHSPCNRVTWAPLSVGFRGSRACLHLTDTSPS